MNDKKYDFILISTHKQVRGALVENNIPFLLVYPAKSLKNEYMDRFKSRGNKQGFLNLMDKNWDVFIQELNDQKGCAKEILGKSKYLMSIFE